MSEETHYLNWLTLTIGTTKTRASKEEPAGSRIQWHPSGHSIYIVSKDMTEIEIRIEREVREVQVSVWSHAFYVIDFLKYCSTWGPHLPKNSTSGVHLAKWPYLLSLHDHQLSPASIRHQKMATKSRLGSSSEIKRTSSCIWALYSGSSRTAQLDQCMRCRRSRWSKRSRT